MIQLERQNRNQEFSVIIERIALETIIGYLRETGSLDSSVNIGTGYGLDGSGSISGSASFFLFYTAFRQALRPTQYFPGSLFPGVQKPGREADHSPPYFAEVKNGGTIIPLLYMPSCRGALIINHRENFTFFLYLLKQVQNIPLCSLTWLQDQG
jgi:hypothetical protein